MSQQINLLRTRPKPQTTVIVLAACLGALLLTLVGYRHSVATETERLRVSAAEGELRLAAIKGTIASVQKKPTPGNDEQSLNAELAALRPKADTVSQLMREVRGGNLGSAQGHARELALLGTVIEDGVWLTGVTISGGNAMRIEGRALRNEAVMQYARRLNAAFAPHGVRFTALEVTPEVSSAAARAAGTPGPAFVAFKLS